VVQSVNGRETSLWNHFEQGGDEIDCQINSFKCFET
jgi:hypothetical protein